MKLHYFPFFLHISDKEKQNNFADRVVSPCLFVHLQKKESSIGLSHFLIRDATYTHRLKCLTEDNR